ncbi:MAG TPA: DNA polymerase ligase N-terminal domain-containing protein [Planctomycetota bacterium]|jgi:DNA polymerase ligase (LigD)-like protein|nr:DNA polymerase ligase N-terminal domain-containing protein [Planctomycetota bacterium]
MARFTISHHTGASEGKDHYDLFLERAGKLKSWRLPDTDLTERVAALMTPDHDLKYLTYEGKLSGSKGSVAIVDSGTYIEDTWGTAGIQVALSGRKSRRRVWLAKTPGAKDSAEWTVEDVTLPARRITTTLLRQPAPEPPPTAELEPLAQALVEEERALVSLAEHFLKADAVDWSRVRTDNDLRGKIRGALARWRHPWLVAAERRVQFVDDLAKVVTPSRAADPAPAKPA